MFNDIINIFAFKKLINIFIKKGKKEKALKIFLYLLYQIKKKTDNKIFPFIYLQRSLDNLYPELYMRRMKKGRIFFYLPKNINEQKKIKIAIFWIKKTSEDKKLGRTVEERVAKPIIQAYNFEGEIIKKKKLLYSILLNNQPFLHIARFSYKYKSPKIKSLNKDKSFEKKLEKIIGKK